MHITKPKNVGFAKFDSPVHCKSRQEDPLTPLKVRRSKTQNNLMPFSIFKQSLFSSIPMANQPQKVYQSEIGEEDSVSATSDFIKEPETTELN